jgi:mRNA interferase RelE/StbE
MTTRWRIVIIPIAERHLAAITDARVRRLIAARIDGLAEEPELQGKPLGDDLAGYRSVRAVGQRWRIVYRVEGRQVTVYVVTVGPRRAGSRADVYALARRLFRQGLLDPVNPDDDDEGEAEEGMPDSR